MKSRAVGPLDFIRVVLSSSSSNEQCRAFRTFGKDVDFIVSRLVFANTERPASTTKEVATISLQVEVRQCTPEIWSSQLKSGSAY